MTAAPPRHVAFTAWRGQALGDGTHQGSVVADGSLGFGTAAGTLTYADPYCDEPHLVGYEWSA